MNQILEILSELVACDTQNPPREHGLIQAILTVVKNRLPNSFRIEKFDHGKGRTSILAVRGQPSLLFNVHLDTVPAGSDWTAPPLKLTREHDKVFGRGVCDIKGAAACLLAVANSLQSDMAILFTTDEEGAESCCVAEFCRTASVDSYQAVIVAEPTDALAVTGHRGYLSVTGQFTGSMGHSSKSDLLDQSANHRAVDWAAAALQKVAQFEANYIGGRSACFNIGRIDGGLKNNMIAGRCLLSWSARLPSGVSNDAILGLLTVPAQDYVSWQSTFAGSSLPRDDHQLEIVEQICGAVGLKLGEPVDFWTEASIFSDHGKPAFVFGPGNIAQAHTPDEWVSVEQLSQAFEIYSTLVSVDINVLKSKEPRQQSSYP